MTTLAELARERTDLTRPQIDQLQRLVAAWGLLADLCFADLMLFAPDVTSAEGASQLVVLGQVRPTTGQTLYRSDWVGNVIDASDRPLVARALDRGEIIDGEVASGLHREPVRELCIPVRLDGETLGVVTRESAPTIGRQPGELERIYVEVFNRFARMIAAGDFPFAGEETWSEEAPRVGDGVILLDSSMRVEYASPNAVSALHRIGVHANAEGMTLTEIGLRQAAVYTAFAKRRPATEEIERGPEITVMLRCIPLLDHDQVPGALILVRDISELRRRDRLLLSKDATIREIHHRVKNNLGTISALLRLQGRRLTSPEAKAAVDESVRRIRSIALVHETLAHAAGEDVPFIDIVAPLVRMVDEGLGSPDQPVEFKVVGDHERLPASIATPMAVVVTEAMQNVVDHGYPRPNEDDPRPNRAGHVLVELTNDGTELRVKVTDDGVGLPPDFSIDRAEGLGLSIIRTLVTSELNGTIGLYGAGGPPGREGTVMDIRVPIAVSVDTGQVPIVQVHRTQPVPIVRVDET